MENHSDVSERLKKRLSEVEHERDCALAKIDALEIQLDSFLKNSQLERLAVSLYRARGELQDVGKEKNAYKLQCNRLSGLYHALHIAALDLLELKDLADSCDALGIERPGEYYERKKIAWAAMRGLVDCS